MSTLVSLSIPPPTSPLSPFFHALSLAQGTLPVEAPLEALVGLRVPHLFFAAKRSPGDKNAPPAQPGPFSAGPYLTPKVDRHRSP